jgi:multidrug efflux pump subunit AcrA (membrane-fusion protein)
MKKLIAITISVLIAVGLVLGAVKLVKKRKAEEAKLETAKIYPIVVKTAQPKENATLTYPYLALVKNDSTVTITTKFTGKVKEIAQTGQKVNKGEIVAKIDDTNLKTNLKMINDKINSIKEKLNAENITLKNLIATHKRTKALLDVKMASIEEYQMEESKIASLKAQIKADKNNLTSLKSQKEAILNDLKYTQISSPVDGIVSSKFVNKGDNAFPGKPLLTIASKDGNYLFVVLPDNYKQAIYKNKMYNLIPLHTTFNGVPAYKIDVNDKNLILGEKIKIKLVSFSGNATILPYDAILTINGKNYVFIPNGNQAQVKEITILAKGIEGVAIKEDINSPVIVAKPDILLRIKAGYPIKVKG